MSVCVLGKGDKEASEAMNDMLAQEMCECVCTSVCVCARVCVCV